MLLFLEAKSTITLYAFGGLSMRPSASMGQCIDDNSTRDIENERWQRHYGNCRNLKLLDDSNL